MKKDGLSKEDFLKKLNAELKYGMIKYCMHNSFTREDAKDLFQIMLSKLWLSDTLDTSDFRKALQFAWLTLNRSMIDAARRKKVNLGPNNSVNIEDADQSAYEHITRTPFDVYKDNEVGEAIERAVNKLSGKTKYVAKRRLKEVPYGKIIKSKQYPMTINGAKIQWHRAKPILIKELSEFENYY